MKTLYLSGHGISKSVENACLMIQDDRSSKGQILLNMSLNLSPTNTTIS